MLNSTEVQIQEDITHTHTGGGVFLQQYNRELRI